MTSAPSILLITSNGFGMGHLIRQLAIAGAMPAEARCTLMTLSQAAPVAAAAGVSLEYCPSYTSPWLTKRMWHRGYLRDRILALATEVRPDVIAFDGVVPYPGLLAALTHLPARRVWFRRGVWRRDAATAPLAYSSFFDLIIEPGDVGYPCDDGPTAHRTDATRVGVITDAGPDALLPRADAAAHLGVDPQRPVVLFNVGSNAIPGLADIQRTLLSVEPWQVLSTKDALGRERSGDAGVTPIHGLFPLHPYLSAVDLAVTSVGYNAAHEFLGAGVPTILVPAHNATDDQRARAEAIARAGAAVVVSADDPATLQSELARIMSEPDLRSAMRSAALSLRAQWGDGAAESVDLLLAQAQSSTSQARPSMAARIRLTLRLVAERVLEPVSAGLHPQPVTLSTTLTAATLADATAVVEHLHPGTSPAYRQARVELARRWFPGDVTTP